MMKRRYVPIKSSILNWVNTDAKVLIFVAKSITAGILALYISMYLNLPDPRTALFTVFIVMQPKSGLVLSKSFYRIVGTFIGAVVSLMLIGAFSQDPFWFIAFFALWIGICTGASVKYRNFQAYGFILAGYTVAIVALPAINIPSEAFDVAVSRFSEVFVGIICATVISDAVFPVHISDSLFESELKRVQSLVSAFSNTKNILEHSEETALKQSFFSGAIGLNAAHVNSGFESASDNKERLHYQHLNNEFMHLSTTFFSFKNCIAEAEKSLPVFAFNVIKTQSEKIAAMFSENQSSVDESSVERLIKTLNELIVSAQKDFQQAKSKLPNTEAFDVFSASEALLVRLMREIKAYFTTFLSLLRIRLSKKEIKNIKPTLEFSTHADGVFVVLSVLRGIVLIVLSFSFWIYTTWPFAVQMITMAVISGILFGTLPNPTSVIKSFIGGAVVAFALVGAWDFYVIPAFTSDILTLAIVISPVLAVAAWLITMPKWTGFALGFTYMFLTLCSLDPYYKIAPTVFLESGLASIMGLMLATASYVFTQYFVVVMANQRVAKALSKLIVSICKDGGKLERAKMESIGRDLLQQFSTHGKIDLSGNSPIFRWLLTTMEIGQSLIRIKKNSELLKKLHIDKEFENILETMKIVFEKPSQNSLAALLDKLSGFNAAIHNVDSIQALHGFMSTDELLSEISIIKTAVRIPGAIPTTRELYAA